MKSTVHQKELLTGFSDDITTNIDKPLYDILKRRGLDIVYWAKILQDLLGITKLQQMEYLNEIDYALLKKNVRYHWESKAVDDLSQDISIRGNSNASLENKKDPKSFQKTAKDEIQQTCMRDETKRKEKINIINKLGLQEFYPNKMQLWDVIKVKDLPATTEFSDTGWVFLKNLMMTNFNARDVLIEKHLEHLMETKTSIGSDWNDDENAVEDVEATSNKDIQTINPLDLLVAIWECTSPILKQTLASKLFVCRLAIPFALTPNYDDLPIINLWPIRHIIIEQKINKGSIQSSALKCPCHVVTFLRLGRLSVSKSKLVNQILSDQYHDTFFNKDCSLGTSQRCISDGMIESAWDLSSSDSDTLSLYLNLRGDGLLYEGQVKLLSQISSVVVVMLDVNLLKDLRACDVLFRLHQCMNGIVLAIDAYSKSESDAKLIFQQYMKDIPEYRKKTKICKLAVSGMVCSSSHIKKEMIKGITETTQTGFAVTLTKRLSEGRGTFFKTDEDLKKFKQARQKAVNVSNLIPSGQNVKERVVPLQGKLWLQFSETQKKTNQSTIYQAIVDIERKKDYMMDQREKQLSAYKNQGALMTTFVSTLLKNEQSDEDCILFVAYLKQHLDDISRNVLPEFLTQYQCAWQKLKTARGTNGSGIEMLQEKYKAAEYNLANASFGFEHLIRECGQIYEAIMACEREATTEDKVIAEGLGCMCAKLLLLGQPIEVMDGDAANVPLRWVAAVLKQLKQVIGDKKILTLSVLGIQSSGKSTLLNAMFGLQFAVSAGRCTRGVYAQLVPVESKTMDFDFILVFDTEGLRASELGHQKHDHDNKLATFVIGIGDITIVNIKGENTSEIKDILQIAVHAFLRLKLVNKRLNLKQGCVFVHQNVPATDANDKMMHGRQKLVEQLDEMTKEAAEQERITSITTFDQVIEFDCEKNVWYFSDLWVGDPPMAPTNPGYSNSAACVKQAVLTQIVPSRKTFLTLTNTIIRIQDLWKGILRDDFVYGFRNSLEMKAYSSMEKRYQEISWAMHKFFFEFTVSNAKPALESSIDEESLNKKVAWITKTLNIEAEKNITILIVNLESFVKNSELQDVMNQWIQTKTMRLRILKDSLVASTEADIINLREEKKIKILQIKDKTKHELQINERARQLANEMHMKGQRANRKQMSEKFEHMWSDWLQGFSGTIQKVNDVRSVQDKIQGLIWEQFSDLTSYFITQLKDDEYITPSHLVGSLSSHDFEIGKHLEIHRNFNPLKMMGLKKENHEKYLDYIVDLTDMIFRKVHSKLRHIENQDTRFNIKYVTDILSILVEAIDDHNDNKSKAMKYNLLHPYKALLIYHVVQYITSVFTIQEDEYMKRHSLIGQLVGYKETAWELFKNVVGKKTEDIISASFLKKALEKVVIDHVSELLPIDVQDAMLLKFSHQKYSIIRDVMIYLAEEGSFNECQSYIKDPVTFVEEWLTKLMVKVVFEECSGDNEYTRYAAKHISSIIIAIEKSIHMVKKSIDDSSTVSITTWIEEFTKQLTDLHALPISAHTFVHVEEKSVTDIQIFVKVVLHQLVEIEENALNHFRKTKAENVIWKHNPLSKIMKELWGCEEKCPFCCEPCKSTDKDHVELGIVHQCLQHRIKGLSNRSWEGSGNLTLNFCNIDVQKDIVLFRSAGSDEWTKYKDYKKEHPNWDIEPTPDTSKYWMWLLCKYQSNFEEKYEKKFETIPPSWFNITQEEAVQSLKT